MLDLSPDAVLQEIQAAEELRKRHLVNCTTLVKRYLGNYYRTDLRGRPIPENLIFTFVAEMLPQLVFDNPQVSVSAQRLVSHKPIADFMRMAMNGWIKHVRLRDELEMLALDTLFGFGVALIGLEPRGDYSTGVQNGVWGRFTMDALMPFGIRLSPGAAIIDSQCDTWHSARILGHQFQRDVSDLKGDERYDQLIVERLAGDDDMQRGQNRAQTARPSNSTDAWRNRVTMYQLYFPEHRKIGTLALQSPGGGRGSAGKGAAAWIRPPIEYHGPRTGPYVFFGVYGAPDQTYPLSPIAAMAEQAQELNAHATAAAKRAAKSKRIVIVDAAQPTVADQIQTSEDGDVVRARGFSSSAAGQFDIGGNTPDQLNYLAMLLERTDRISGQSEARRGRAQGVTATESRIAQANSDARSEFVHLKFREGVKRLLEGIGWYCFYDSSVVFPVSEVDPHSGQPFEGLFLGGVQDGQEELSWMDFYLDMEPMSMRRVDPAVQQEQAQMTLAIAVQIAPLIPQFPYMNWNAILDMLGEANNIPDFAKRVLNQVGMQLIQAAMMPGVMPSANPMAGVGLPATIAPEIRTAAMGGPAGLLPGARKVGVTQPASQVVQARVLSDLLQK